MAKNTLGYVELEWTCPNCGNKNPGPVKSCTACGSPQPEDVQFELGQKRDLVADAQKQTEAASDADIHCPFCNTRNPAGTQVCIQCGGDLKEGLRRESGRVLNGGPVESTTPITCPSCGKLNPVGNNTCQACGAQLVKPQIPVQQQAAVPAPTGKPSAFRPWMALPVIAILAVCCVIAGFFLFRTTALTGVVEQIQWQRMIAIQEQRQVTHETWRDQLPGDAEILSCRQEYRNRQENPAPGARAVCSTELVDQGNGYAEAVETCYYEVFDDYCQYQALEWQTVDRAVADGADLQPYWPQLNLAGDQREGERSETYKVFFETKDGTKEFTTRDAALFAQLRPGTEWTLSINTLGAIVDVSP